MTGSSLKVILLLPCGNVRGFYQERDLNGVKTLKESLGRCKQMTACDCGWEILCKASWEMLFRNVFLFLICILDNTSGYSIHLNKSILRDQLIGSLSNTTLGIETWNLVLCNVL